MDKRIKFRWEIIVLDYLFPVLAGFSLLLATLESVTYAGFAQRFLLFDAQVYYAAAVVCGIALTLLALFLGQAKKLSQSRIFLNLNRLLTPLLLLLYFVMALLEETHFPNYVFSELHVTPENFARLVILCCVWLVFDFVLSQPVTFDFLLKQFEVVKKSARNSAETAKGTHELKDFVFTKGLVLIFYLLVFLYGVTQTFPTFQLISTNIIKIARNPLAGYDDKMRTSWGIYYNYFQFVDAYAPEDAVIWVPPTQNHWLTEGNKVVSRYFVYPRKVVNVVETNELATLDQLPKEKFTHVAIVPGRWPDSTVNFGWPRLKIEGNRIWWWNPETREASEAAEPVYVYDAHGDNRNKWGLIELKEPSQL